MRVTNLGTSQIGSPNGKNWQNMDNQMSHDDSDRLEAKLDAILTTLNGDGRGEMGMVQKVAIMWRFIVLWPLCTGSAALGAVFTIIIQYFSNK